MIHANDAFAPVAFLQLKSLSLQEKEDITSTLDKSSQKELIEKSGVVIKVRNIWFLSPLVPSKREKNIQTETTQFDSVCIFFERNDKIHNYVKL